MIRTVNASYQVGSRELVCACSMQVPVGSVTAILGPNGAGKSTLLKILSGELTPSRGCVEFNERPLPSWPLPQLARRRAMVSQFQRVSLPFTCEEIVTLGRAPYLHEESDDERRAAVDFALAAVDALPLRHRLFATLSGGEQQRIAIARALAQLAPAAATRQAHALLLDEPTASLDFQHQIRLMQLLRTLAAQGAAVVIVVHDLNLALAWADRAVILNAGQVVAAGSSGEVLCPDMVAQVFGVRASRHVLHGVRVLHIESLLAD